MNNSLDLNLISLGKTLPDWTLEKIFEEDIPNKESYLGKPLLILLFSLGCPGCVGRAIPYANRIIYENGDNINVLGVHTDFEGNDFSKERFLAAKEEFFIRFPFFKDYKGIATFLDYGGGGTPHWILVDKDGNVAYSIFGSDPNNALLRLDLKIGELLEGE